MPKKTKKKISVKQKQKVKVIVNVNNKTARRRRYAPRQPKQPQQPQQIIIQQPSMISRELPMPMFNPIQQASAPPVFQGVGQMLQPPNELLRNIYRETPDFENYSQMPYMESNLQAPQFEDPAEIQREVSSVSSSVASSVSKSPSSFEKYVNELLSRPLNVFSDVNATNKGFNEPIPKDIPLPEMINPKRVQFSDDEASLQPTLNLTKPDPKIIQNILTKFDEETDTSLATTTTKKPKKKKRPKERLKITDGDEPKETQIVAPDFFTFGTPKQRGRGRPSNKLIPTEGKIENTIYNLIMNSTTADFINSGVGALNELLRGVGAPYYQKMKKPEKIQYLLRYQKKETKGNKLFDDLIAQID
jgi:hypothetical protein